MLELLLASPSLPRRPRQLMLELLLASQSLAGDALGLQTQTIGLVACDVCPNELVINTAFATRLHASLGRLLPVPRRQLLLLLLLLRRCHRRVVWRSDSRHAV